MLKPEQVENVVIYTSPWRVDDILCLYPETEEVHYTQAEDIQSLMVELGVFPSKSKAMRANRQGPIPKGWTEFKASKKRMLWIWNPSE